MDISNATNTIYICIDARTRNLRSAFNMAVSPPVTASMATAGASKTK